MTTSIRITALIVLSFGAPSMVTAQDVAVQATIQQRYDELGQAIAARDYSKIREIEAPDYKSVSIDGKVMSRDQELSGIAKMPKLDDRATKTVVTSLTLKDGSAYVEQNVESDFQQTGSDGKPHKLHLMAHSSDVWQMRAGMWVIVRTETLDIIVLENGAVLIRKTQPHV